MITVLVINTLVALLNVFFLPIDALGTFLGGALATTMIADFGTGVGYFFSFMNVFWPLIPVWQVFLFYLSVKVVLTVSRMIFGNRVPDSS